MRVESMDISPTAIPGMYANPQQTNTPQGTRAHGFQRDQMEALRASSQLYGAGTVTPSSWAPVPTGAAAPRPNTSTLPGTVAAKLVQSVRKATNHNPVIITLRNYGETIAVGPRQPVLVVLPSHPSVGVDWRGDYADLHLGKPSHIKFIDAEGKSKPGAPGWTVFAWLGGPRNVKQSGVYMPLHLERNSNDSQKHFIVTLVSA